MFPREQRSKQLKNIRNFMKIEFFLYDMMRQTGRGKMHCRPRMYLQK